MNKAQHTPGPWFYDLHHDSDDNFVLYDLDWDGEFEGGSSFLEGSLVLEDGAVNEANARLIAAAPVLLEACEIALTWFNDNYPKLPRHYGGGHEREALRRAIFEAEGDES